MNVDSLDAPLRVWLPSWEMPRHAICQTSKRALRFDALCTSHYCAPSLCVQGSSANLFESQRHKAIGVNNVKRCSATSDSLLLSLPVAIFVLTQVFALVQLLVGFEDKTCCHTSSFPTALQFHGEYSSGSVVDSSKCFFAYSEDPIASITWTEATMRRQLHPTPG